MERDAIIQKLKSRAPVITQVTATEDMGFEFSAVVPYGVIHAEPGMLLGYSGGRWPPDEWEGKSGEETDQLLRDFLLDTAWQVKAWEDLSNEDLEQWLEDVIDISSD